MMNWRKQRHTRYTGWGSRKSNYMESVRWISKGARVVVGVLEIFWLLSADQVIGRLNVYAPGKYLGE